MNTPTVVAIEDIRATNSKNDIEIVINSKELVMQLSYYVGGIILFDYERQVYA